MLLRRIGRKVAEQLDCEQPLCEFEPYILGLRFIYSVLYSLQPTVVAYRRVLEPDRFDFALAICEAGIDAERTRGHAPVFQHLPSEAIGLAVGLSHAVRKERRRACAGLC